MKKGEPFDMEATEANIKLNEEMNADYKQTVVRREVSSTTEANNAIQEAFYSDNQQEDFYPAYINNNTAAIKVTGKDR